MEIKSKFCCPHCDRTIFNRLVGVCEFCHETLPEHLLKRPSKIKNKQDLLALKESVAKVDFKETTQQDDNNNLDSLYEISKYFL